MNTVGTSVPVRREGPALWRKVGVGGLLFFTVKGLAWLALPLLYGYLY